MNMLNYKLLIEKTPIVLPVFVVKKVPSWADGLVEKGDEIVRDVNAFFPAYEEVPTFKLLKNGSQIALGVTGIEFVEYRQFVGNV